jgi:hypothetical protein
MNPRRGRGGRGRQSQAAELAQSPARAARRTTLLSREERQRSRRGWPGLRSWTLLQEFLSSGWQGEGGRRAGKRDFGRAVELGARFCPLPTPFGALCENLPSCLYIRTIAVRRLRAGRETRRSGNLRAEKGCCNRGCHAGRRKSKGLRQGAVCGPEFGKSWVRGRANCC